jgi:hypothetical protein
MILASSAATLSATTTWAGPAKHESAGKGLIIRLRLDGLSYCDDLRDLFFTDSALKYLPDGMDPKDQAKLDHSLATLMLCTPRRHGVEKRV